MEDVEICWNLMICLVFFLLNRSMIYYVGMLLVESVFLSVLFQKVRAFSGWR